MLIYTMREDIHLLRYSLQLRRKLNVVDDISVEDLALDFTIPGYDIELRVSIWNNISLSISQI